MRGIITMKSNFFADYRDENHLDIGLVIHTLWYSYLFSVLVLIGRVVIDVIFFNFNLESIPSDMVVFSVIVGVAIYFVGCIGAGIYNYFDERDNRYALFNTDALKKWYALTPKKFVFSSKGDVVYYIHNEESVATYNYRENNFEKYYLDTTRMYPRTLFEAFKYRHFVKGVFKAMEKAEKNEAEKLRAMQEQKDIIYGNNEMLRVMDSVQKDIDEVHRINLEMIKIRKEALDKRIELDRSVYRNNEMQRVMGSIQKDIDEVHRVPREIIKREIIKRRIEALDKRIELDRSV